MTGVQRKWTAAVVALIMLCTVVLSGCSGTKNDAATPSTSPNTSPSASKEAESPAPLEEPVELTIIGPDVNGPTGVQDDPVAKEIERLTGVRMNLTSASAVSDINAKLAAQIASDDLSDIIFFTNNDLMQSAISANELLPLDDLIAEYGQDLKKNVPLVLDYSRTNLSVNKNGESDGKTYVIGGTPVGPYGYDTFNSYTIPSVRYDLFKKLGYPEVDSIDAYIPLMKQMLALEPETADGKKVYGTGIYMGDSAWNGDYVMWASVPAVYGYTVNTYTSVVDMITGDFVNFVGDPDSKFYAAGKLWNQFHREGLLDPDSFTMKKDEFVDKVTQGRYVFVWQSNRTLDYNANALKNGEKEKYFVPLPPPKDTQAVWWSVDQPVGTPGTGWAISKKTKHPEKAFKLLNFLASNEGMLLLFNGIKETHWNDVNGLASINPEVYQQWLTDPDFSTKTGAGKYSKLAFVSDNTINPDYNKLYNLFLDPELQIPNMNPATKEMLEHYGVNTPAELVTRQVKQTIASVPESALIPALPKELADIANNVDKYVFDNFMKMIIAKNDEQYEAEKTKFLEGVKKVGNDTVVKWYQDERIKAKAALEKMKSGQ